MKHFLLYGHGGSYNHGAEAIVKCTCALLHGFYPDCKITLSTHFKRQDLEFHLPVDEYCERDIRFLNKDNQLLNNEKIYKPTLDQISKNTVCLSVGGDNYCYPNWKKWRTIQETALKRGALSILWSCSVEPSMMTDEMIAALRSHDLITARETLTYRALKEKGLKNVVPCSDIAFLLKATECPLPGNFAVGNTVAVNISPLAVRREKERGIILKTVDGLIQSILQNTDMGIAFIPHVLMPSDNDLELLKDLYDRQTDKKRICLIDKNLSASQYKYIISKCRFGIFSRTHASIAAYASLVPSVVLGYSVKSKGIADDLKLSNYVIPIGELSGRNKLLLSFQSLMDNEKEIKKILSNEISSYKGKARINPLDKI